MPASTGTHDIRWVSHRGVILAIWGTVLVEFARVCAAASLNDIDCDDGLIVLVIQPLLGPGMTGDRKAMDGGQKWWAISSSRCPDIRLASPWQRYPARSNA